VGAEVAASTFVENRDATTSALAQTHRATASRGERRALLLLAPVALYVLVVLVVPLFVVIRASFASLDGTSGFTLANYAEFFTSSYYWGVIWTTVLLSLLAVAGTVAVGVPYAYWLLRRPGGRTFHLLALFAPLLINQVVRIFGLQVLISSLNRGLSAIHLPNLPLMYNFWAVLLAQVIYLFPFMVIAVFAALSRLPVSVEEAAATLGANRARTFWHVVIPACRPGIIAGTVLTFTMSAGAYLIPSMMGGGKVTTVPVLIYNDVSEGQSVAIAAVVGLVLMVIVLPILGLASSRRS
jgi:putative spermidine/putrescine transport system permease protein